MRFLAFREAIEMGEYDPDLLSKYEEWKGLSKHAQLQYIRKALDNRRHQLLSQWTEVNNAIDFRLKPEMQQSLKILKLNLMPSKMTAKSSMQTLLNSLLGVFTLQ